MHKLGIRRYLVAGILLILPIWLTYLVARFLLTTLAGMTAPAFRAAGWPESLDWLLVVVGALVTLVLIYLVGWFGSRLVGQRMVELMDRLLERIPLVQTVYGGTRKLLHVMRGSPASAQQVVLVEIPEPRVCEVGLVTRYLTDTRTGADLAAVYFPGTPNPTSGFLRLVPVDRLQPSDMTVDEAMSFIISGGVITPPRFVEKAVDPTGSAAAGD